MEENLKLDPEAKVSPEDFQALPKEEELDAEKIAAPSLTFTQDAWRRLKKNKGAVISLFVIIVMIVVAFGSTPFINHDTLVKSCLLYTSPSPRDS